MSTFYDKRKIIQNNNQMYKQYFTNMSQGYFLHHGKPDFSRITEAFLDSIRLEEYIWKTGDTFRKIAYSKYNNSGNWFYIALVNRKGSDMEMSPGDVIYLPASIDEVINRLNNG